MPSLLSDGPVARELAPDDDAGKAPGAALPDARSRPAPRRLNGLRRRLWLSLAALLALAAGGLVLLLSQGQAPLATLVLYGNVDIREVLPAFNDSGRITRVLVHEGETVRQGELIATLDDTRYAAALSQAQGVMQSAGETLRKLLAGSRPEEIAEAKANMEALRVIFENDETNWRRYESAARTGAGSLADRDNARAALDAAQERYQAARQAYLLAVAGPRAEDIAAARADLLAAQAAVALARREFADTRLYAPANGMIEDRILEPGDMASPGTPVFTVALTSPLWVRAYVPESDLGHVALGMAATVTTDSFPGRVYHGWIGFLSPTAEFTPKTVETPGAQDLPGVPGACLRLRRAGRASARNAGNRACGSPRPAGGAAPSPGCGQDGNAGD